MNGSIRLKGTCVSFEIGEARKKQINAPMMLGTLGVIESGLLALGIPHGEGGIAAAAAHLGGTLGA